MLPAVDVARARVVRLAHGTVNRATRRALRVALGAALLADIPGDYGFVPWEMPANFFDFIFGWIGVGLDWLRDWIMEAVGRAVRFAINLVTTLQAQLHPLFDSVFGTFDWVLDRVEGMAVTVAGFADRITSDIAHAVTGVIETVGHLIGDAVNGIWQALPSVVSGLIRSALNGIESLWSTIVEGVRAGLNGLIGFVNDTIIPNLNELWDAVNAVGDFAFDTIWDLFWDALRLALGIAESPLDILRAGWWVIKFAADIAGTVAEDAFKLLVGGGLDDLMSRVESAVNGQESDITAWVENALGL